MDHPFHLMDMGGGTLRYLLAHLLFAFLRSPLASGAKTPVAKTSPIGPRLGGVR
jgi:hypothetical protein